DRAGDHALVAAGGFHHHQPRSKFPQPFDQCRQPFAVARGGKAFIARPQMHIEPILRYVDADKVLHVPSLRMRAGLAALATVRAEGTDGWGAKLRSGLLGPRSDRSAIRHRDTHSTSAPR